MPTYIKIFQCAESSSRVTIQLNDLGGIKNYKSLNPLKSEVADIRLSNDNKFVEIMFTSLQNQLLCATAVFTNELAAQGVAPIDEVGGVTMTTNEQMLLAILTLLG